MILSKKTRLFVLPVLILLIAAFARLWNFGEAPPGLQHDELFKAQEGRWIIENGDIRIFYPSNQGHEGGYVWLLALSYALFGANVVMVKMPALWCGLVTVALLYRFTYDYYGYRAAVIASGLAAVSFWAIFNSRVGLRAVSLPLVTLIVLWGVWRLCFYRCHDERRRWRIALFTGAALGFSIYTYTSSIVLFVAYPIFVAALLALRASIFRRRFRELVLIGVVGVILALPMVNVRLSDPEGQNRVSTISEPWAEFRAGKPQLLLNNARLLAGMFAFDGDPEWRYNVSGRPVFATPFGLLVYVGLAVAVWQMRRKPLNVMVLALGVVGLVPSLLTTAAPSFLRSVVVMPIAMILLALAIDQIARLRPGFSGLAWGVGIIAIVATAATDWPAYFVNWARNDEVLRIYREDLKLLGDYLREHDEPLALVSTNAPDPTLDPRIYAFSSPPERTDVVWFDGHTNIALSEKPALLFISPLAPITPPHADWLTAANGTEYLGPLRNRDGKPVFDIYRLSAEGHALETRLAQVSQWPIRLVPPDVPFPSGKLDDWAVPQSYPINFGNIIQLAGADLPQMTRLPAVTTSKGGSGINLQLYLQPLVRHLDVPMSIFVHIIAADGKTIIFQRDFLGVPGASWTPDVTFMQDHFVWLPEAPPGRYYLTLGIYSVVTGERFQVLDKAGHPVADRIMLAAIDIVPK